MADPKENSELGEEQLGEQVSLSLLGEQSRADVALATTPIVVPEPVDEILVPEPIVLWPADVTRTAQRDISSRPNKLFRAALIVLQRAFSEYEWIPLFKDRETKHNSITRLPSLLRSLEQLFERELLSPFNEAQLLLLKEADCILIGYDKHKEAIISYSSVRHSNSEEIPELDCQITNAGHLIIAAGHEKKAIGPSTASVIALYGHRVVENFKPDIVVVRSSNKYVERLMKRAPPTFRSDKLTAQTSSTEAQVAMRAIKWTHRNVFHYDEDVILGKPMKISHRFPESALMDDLAVDEIVYLARKSSMALFIYKVIAYELRKRYRTR